MLYMGSGIPPTMESNSLGVELLFGVGLRAALTKLIMLYMGSGIPVPPKS